MSKGGPQIVKPLAEAKRAGNRKAKPVMPIIKLFQKELRYSFWGLLAVAFASGTANAAVLALINAAVSELPAKGTNTVWWIAGGLLIAMCVYSVSQWTLMTIASKLTHSAIAKIRANFITRLQSARLTQVEELSEAEFHACISVEMQNLSDAALHMTIFCQGLLVLLLSLVYLAWLSFGTFLLFVVFVCFMALVHMRQAAAITAQIKAAFGLETQLIEGLTDFLRGFKEIKLNSLKSLEFGEHMKQLSANVAQGRIAAQREIAGNFVTSELMVFSLLGIVVFILPLATDLPTSTVVTVAATVLFMNGPISLVLGGVSLLQKMNAAAEAILLLDDRLSSFAMPPVVPSSAPSVFDRITLRGVYFRYRNEYEREGFALGPIDLEIKRGQIIFIVGKNGCGKSTLLKLVTGLYSPSQGTLSIDEQEVTAENAPTYSNLFSSIFADSHLTRRLYGIPDLNAAEVEELLDLLEINDKTRLVGKTFETVALSTGQRKRLLMVTALLEHRSVYVFDEWAADQDIHYRNKFYRMILPKLKSLGKTVVAVTHDENYFDAADVCLQFDDGQLRTWSDSKSRAVL